MYISNSIKTEIVTITPRVAAELIAQNKSNRKVSMNNLAKVKASMKEGEWELNGEAIKIAKDGRVLDGQHRLIASAETDTTFQTLLVYGLEDSTQDSMDTGKSRTLADVLAIRGYKNATSLAAVTMAIMRGEWGGVRAGAMAQWGAGAITNKQAMERIAAEPSLTELPKIVGQHARIGLPTRIAGYLFYLFSTIDSEDASYFFDRLVSGDGLERGNPILTLRNQLMSLKAERGTQKQDYIAALTIKAWNKFRDGDSSVLLRFAPGGANPEKYPEPK